MDEHTVRHYFKRGMEKGFSKEYVKQIMINKGYDPALVNYVYNKLVQEELEKNSQDFSYQPRQFEFEKAKPETSSKFSFKNKIILGVVLLFLVVGSIIVFYPKERTVTTAVVGMEGDVETRLNEITEMDKEISEKKAQLRRQLDELKQKDLTIEEKNRVIHQQITELEKLHEQIDEERTKIKDLLWDLLNAIIERPNKNS